MSGPVWKGPKEWRPQQFWPESSLLSLEEKIKARKIERAAKQGKASPEDTLWLLGIARRMAAISPDDFQFPERLGLVNPIALNAYAMRYEKTSPFLNTVTITGPYGLMKAVVMDITTTSAVMDAIFVVRPYLRVLAAQDKEATQKLRMMPILMTIDGEKVLEGSLSDVLIAQDRSFFTKADIRIRGPYRRSSLFYGASIGPNNQIPGDSHEGIMCPNGANILIQIDNGVQHPVPSGDTKLMVGLVAATYIAEGVSSIDLRRPNPVET